MLDIILKDIIPIFVIMLLGFASGKAKAFAYQSAQIFNKFVLNYALPAALFLSIVKADRHMIFQDLKLTIVSFVVIIAVFMWSYFSCYKFFKHTRAEAAICALIAGSPTIGFLGFAVLDPIFGNTPNTGLVVAIVAIVANPIAIPIGLALLDPGKQKRGEHEPDISQAHENWYRRIIAWAKPHPVINALLQPVAWSPILAVVFVMCGIKFPSVLDPNFMLIDKANAGVAVFAAGLTLSGLKFQFNWEIMYNTLVKLILMPGILLLVGWLVNMEAEKLQMLVLAGALPPAFSGIIISSRYQVYVRTGTSSLAVSVLLFMGTAPLWIWLSRLVGA